MNEESTTVFMVVMSSFRVQEELLAASWISDPRLAYYFVAYQFTANAASASIAFVTQSAPAGRHTLLVVEHSGIT